MSELARFSVSLEGDLLEEFDRFCAEGRFATRSEAIRQLLRDRLTAAASASDEAEMAASLTLVYDHHRAGLTDRMLNLQHGREGMVVATMHVHLDHDLCMEVIVLRGPAGQLRELAGELGGLKGIRHAHLDIAAAGSPNGGHAHPHPH